MLERDGTEESEYYRRISLFLPKRFRSLNARVRVLVLQILHQSFSRAVIEVQDLYAQCRAKNLDIFVPYDDLSLATE